MRCSSGEESRITRIALEKLEKIRCITSLKKLFHGVLFKSNVPRCQIFSSFPLSSHEPPVVEDETVLIAVRKRSSPEEELEFACQPHGVREFRWRIFWNGRKKIPNTIRNSYTTAVFLRLGHSDVHQFKLLPIALYKNPKKNPSLVGTQLPILNCTSYSDF